MTTHRFMLGISRRADPLGSWNDGAAKRAIIDFVRAATDLANPNFVGPEDRIATFDLDGKAGRGMRLAMLVLHDDAKREYAYGPAEGLPNTRVGYFPQGLYDEAKKQGWIVISMKNDWKRIFAFE